MSRAKTARDFGDAAERGRRAVDRRQRQAVAEPAVRAVTSVSVGARLMKDGKFEFPNVTPGQYVIQVDRGRRNASTEGEFGTLPVIGRRRRRHRSRAADVGRLVDHRPRHVRHLARHEDAEAAAASTSSAGSDRSRSVAGERRRTRTSTTTGASRSTASTDRGGCELQRAPAGWTLKEIRVNGIDVTDRPLAFGKAEPVAGRRRDRADRSHQHRQRHDRRRSRTRRRRRRRSSSFPPDRDRWYPASRFLRAAPAGADGAIALAGLPAGSYYAAAVRGAAGRRRRCVAGSGVPGVARRARATLHARRRTDTGAQPEDA